MVARRSRSSKRSTLWIVCVVLLCASIAPTASAQTYPTKPIRLIVPFPPGGGNDIVGRIIGGPLSERLGKQVVIDNRGGAGGIVGTEIAAKSQPDGYTLLIISVSHAYKGWFYKLPYDPVKSFVPVTTFATSPMSLVVYPGLPVNSVKELIALAKAKPGQLISAGSIGAIADLASALFSSLAGINIVRVPFNGAGPMIISVAANESQMTFNPLMVTLPHISSGRLKVVGIGGAKRSAVLPNVPTIAEAGVPGYEVNNWWGVIAPAGMSPGIVKRLHTEISAILTSAETQKWFASQGAEPVNMTSHQFSKLIVAEIAKWGKVVKEMGIRAE